MRSMVLQWRKWDGAEHWRHELEPLGEDETGRWFGQREGSLSVKPDAEHAVRADNVWNIVPGRGWTARFFRIVEQGGWQTGSAVGTVGVYADIGTDVRIERDRVTGIDLDLDVIRLGERLWLDDEDEFAQHRVQLGYPDAVADAAARDGRDVLAMVGDGIPPFDEGRGAEWLARFAASRGL